MIQKLAFAAAAGPYPLIPTPGEILARSAREWPDHRMHTYLTFDGVKPRSVTYSEMYRRACGTARVLSELGMRGRPVLLIFPAGEEFSPAFFGTVLAGAVAVPVPVPQFESQHRRLEGVTTDCLPGAVLTTQAVAAKLLSRLPADSPLRSCPWLTDPAPEDSRFEPEPVAPSDVALLQYTSGSTSDPKGVAVSHGNLSYNLRMIGHGFDPPADCRNVSWLPHFHDMGLIVGVMGPLICRSESILMAPLSFLQRPMRWLEVISEWGAQVAGGPNFAYDLCVQAASRGEIPGLDLTRWRIAYVGAEPIRPSTLAAFSQRFQAYGFEASGLIPSYGLAEATLFVTSKPAWTHPIVHSVSRVELAEGRVEPSADPNALKLMGCGWPAPDTEVRIVEPERRIELRPGEVGEIWVRGPQVAKGYWTAPDDDPFDARLAETGEGPFLRTGDLGFLDPTGELVFVSRLKDVIIINGQNHVSHDLERTAAESHPLLSSDGCAAVALYEMETTHLALIAELPRDVLDRAEEVARSVRSALFSGHGLAPRTIAFVGPRKLSRTTSGKLQRRLNAQRLEAGEMQLLASFGEALPSPLIPVPDPVSR